MKKEKLNKNIFYVSLLTVLIIILQIPQGNKSEEDINNIEKYKSSNSIRICNHN